MMLCVIYFNVNNKLVDNIVYLFLVLGKFLFFEIGRYLEVINLRFVVLCKICFFIFLGFMILLVLFENRIYVRLIGINFFILVNVI